VAKLARDIEIQARPEDVFEELVNWLELSRWSTITVQHTGPDRASRVGEEFDQRIRVAGVPLQTQWRVVELDPPRLVTYDVTAAGGGRMTMRQRVVPVGTATRVELELDYVLPGGFLGEALDRAFVERRNEREAEHSLQNLKDLCEGRTPS
jgi:hypothetical protein